MAAQIAPCSSPTSSSSLAFPSEFKPRKCFFSRRFSQVCPIIHARSNFQIKSSNGHPLNAVSSQGGMDGSPLAKAINPAEEDDDFFIDISDGAEAHSTLSITVVGASGDLAKKKIFPALFALYYEDWLPENFVIFGYARTKLADEELRNMICTTLTCRIDKRENCEDKMEQFLKRCFYHSGEYSSEEHFVELDRKLKEKEAGKLSNRLFYLSIPPNIFVDVVRCAGRKASSAKGWTRVIVEKPFGRDSESSAELTRCLKKYLTEEQIFRIDHYLGKELLRTSQCFASPTLFSNLYGQGIISGMCNLYFPKTLVPKSEEVISITTGSYGT